MLSVQVHNIDTIMIGASLQADGIAVTFADGCHGVVPFAVLPEIEDPQSIKSLELASSFELVLLTTTGERHELPYDFVRYYCDEAYRARVMTDAMERTKEVGTRIRAHRKAAGLSQVALAKAAGLPLSAFRRIEAGEEYLKHPEATAIAEALGRPVWDLYRELKEMTSEHDNISSSEIESGVAALEAIDFKAWTETLKHHEAEFAAINEAVGHIFEGINVAIEGFDRLTRNQAPEQDISLIEESMNLTARSFRSLHTATLLCTNGYFGEAMVLVRVAMEHLLVAYALPKDETLRDDLRKGKQINQGGRFKKLALPLDSGSDHPEFTLRLSEQYSWLSEFAHPGGTRRQQVRMPGTNGYAVPFAGQYNPQLSRFALNNIADILLLQIRVVAGLTEAVNVEWNGRAVWEDLRRAYALRQKTQSEVHETIG